LLSIFSFKTAVNQRQTVWCFWRHKLPCNQSDPQWVDLWAERV